MTESFRETVLEVYDTVADQGKWTQVLDKLCGRIDARGCLIFGWDSFSGNPRFVAPHFSSFYTRPNVEEYIKRFWRAEERDQAIFRAHSLATDGVEVIDDTVLAPTPAALAKLETVSALRKLGIHSRAISLLNKDDTDQSRFSVQLTKDRGPLGPQDRAYLTAVLPHIAKALDLGRPALTLQLENQTLLDAMDRLKIGLCVLSGQGQVVAKNIEFARQLDASGVFAQQRDGSLVLNDAPNAERFDQLLCDALHHDKFGARPRKEALSANDGHFLCIEIVPLDRAESIGTGRFGGYLLYSTDTSRGVAFDPALLKKAYGLTDAELALLDYVAQGLTNSQIAARRERAVATVNVQVKSILAKTQCQNRTQLVRLLMNFGSNFV